jgi:putative hydrolase of the HAD superfamily
VTPLGVRPTTRSLRMNRPFGTTHVLRTRSPIERRPVDPSNGPSEAAPGIDRDEMKTETCVTTLFLDIGGVLLTNGWDRHARSRAATHFQLDQDFDEIEDQHHLMFATYEQDKFTLEEYLSRTVFQKERRFTRAQFRDFMFAQSQPYPAMLDLMIRLKARHGLKIAVLSNEARELNAYRIRTFQLTRFVDHFISSCFVRLRKPDVGIFRLALDVAQTPVEQIVYIENTSMFVQIAEGLGIPSVLHTDYQSTCAKLASFGLRTDEGAAHDTR